MMFLIYDIATITIRVAAVAYVIGGIYMTSWSGLEDTQILADPSGILSINNSKLGIKYFRLSYRGAAGNDRI